MKFIIIGLGHFGSSLGQNLTIMGHEVIGVDNNMVNVEDNKGLMTHTICLNASDSQAVSSLPINDADAVIVCIGLNEGANLLATANMKLMKAKHLICRAISPLHRTVLEAMQVDEIVYLEEETAHRWAKKLNMKSAIDVHEIAGDFNIVEVTVPKRFVGKTLQESQIRSNYNLLVLSTIKMIEQKNVIGITIKIKQIQEMASAITILDENDIMILYGKIKDFESFLKDI
ncbi:MAG: TrkA family potassium uptake protein [Paludibacter sp.]|nr:TrkA family potassium uptake protein [Paludibacter sp.]